jgi:hypothetical protein
MDAWPALSGENGGFWEMKLLQFSVSQEISRLQARSTCESILSLIGILPDFEKQAPFFGRRNPKSGWGLVIP